MYYLLERCTNLRTGLQTATRLQMDQAAFKNGLSCSSILAKSVQLSSNLQQPGGPSRGLRHMLKALNMSLIMSHSFKLKMLG